MSFSVALRGVFTTIESVFSALLVTIYCLPVRGKLSVSPRILQPFSKGNNINYSLVMSTKMAKHGKELSDDNRKAIIKLIESGHRASQVAQSLKISKCTISRL
jgi:DNA-binding NarL/FixJ family response regulator